MADPTPTNTADNAWRETVRDLYDDLHFGKDNFFTGNPLASRLIKFIEDRHPEYFRSERAPMPAPPS